MLPWNWTLIAVRDGGELTGLTELPDHGEVSELGEVAENTRTTNPRSLPQRKGLWLLKRGEGGKEASGSGRRRWRT